MMLDIVLFYILPVIIAAVIVCFIHPIVIEIALLKGILDKPNARKINDTPIPMLGGVEIYLGLIIAFCLCGLPVLDKQIFLVSIGCLMMLFIGITDDILNLRAKNKLICEVIVVSIFIIFGDLRINNFNGLWGIYEIPDWFSYILTMIAAVGIINSLNLLDGVDGLCSGFGILASFMCGVIFIYLGFQAYAIISFAAFGALIPVFVYNVFSKRLKVFMGDSGALTLGTLFAVFVIKIIQANAPEANHSISLVLAIFAIPVFDTTRVMSMRIYKGNSPFKPDKTHLHHMFIDMGFGHRLTTFNILVMGILIVTTWLVLYLVGIADIYILYSVIFEGILFTFGVYALGQYLKKHNPTLYQGISQNMYLHRNHLHALYVKAQHLLDRK